MARGPRRPQRRSRPGPALVATRVKRGEGATRALRGVANNLGRRGPPSRAAHCGRKGGGRRTAVAAGGSHGRQAMARARCRGQRSRVAGSIVRRDPGVTRAVSGRNGNTTGALVILLPCRSREARVRRPLSSHRWGDPVVLDSSRFNLPPTKVRRRGRGGGLPDRAEATLPCQGRPSSDTRRRHRPQKSRHVGTQA